MIRSVRSALLATAGLVVVSTSCNVERPIAPKYAARATAFSDGASNITLPTVRISEFHYDNAGTDAGEAVEVSFPTGMSLTGWQIILHNGNGGAAYGTLNLSSGVVTACGGGSSRSVVVVPGPATGIQNGSPDGIVLAGSGVVSDSLSYLGSFTAVGGVADGKLLPNIGVSEGGTTPVGFSLQRDGAGVWSAPKANTFGVCNDDEAPPPAAVVTTVTVAPPSATVIVGATQQFTATAFDASSNPIPGVTFTWSSSSPAATVSASGLATGANPGDASITATAPNTIAGSATLHVDAAPPARRSTPISSSCSIAATLPCR